MFQINKYLGLWYELMHSETNFQTSLDFNTMAKYTYLNDMTISVENTTIRNGQKIQINGIAKILDSNKLSVDFTGFNLLSSPNYIINHIWTNDKNEYIAAIVTNAKKDYVSVLCRCQTIPTYFYIEIQSYISKNFPNLNVLQVPHYT